MQPVSDLLNLSGRTALVTGAARGLGAACAARLAEAGATVLATDLDEEALGASASPAMLTARHDVTKEEDWDRVVAHALEQTGRLDILVNNAGIFKSASLTEVTLDALRSVNAVNVEALFMGIKHAVPAMKAGGTGAGAGGSIINLSSIAGIIGLPNGSIYGASKGAVRLLTKHAAVELAMTRTGIRVNSVHPTIVPTDMGDAAIDLMMDIGWASTHEEAEQVAHSLVPMGEFPRPEDIANGILFLASDASRCMTGAELVIDGGHTAA